MGVVYENTDYYAKVDLGLVSPDMYRYRNRYREANRAFGELVTFEVGQVKTSEQLYYYFGSLKFSGKFGIDKLQDFAHEVLSLQPVNNINELVRMPNQTWFGLGVWSVEDVAVPAIGAASLLYQGYVGSDTAYLNMDLSKVSNYTLYSLEYSLGLRAVGYDNLVSAPPIYATERNIIPYVRLGVNFELFGYDIEVNETISVPTIKSDDSIYAVLNAGIKFQF